MELLRYRVFRRPPSFLYSSDERKKKRAIKTRADYNAAFNIILAVDGQDVGDGTSKSFTEHSIRCRII